MPEPINQMPAETIETLARSVFEQASRYGFSRLDQVRLASALLSFCKDNRSDGDEPHGAGVRPTTTPKVPAANLPLLTDRLSIEAYDESVHRPYLERWTRDAFGGNFLLISSSPRARDLEAALACKENQFAVICTRKRSPIGVLAFFDCNVRHRRAEFRILIGKSSARRNGFGYEAAVPWLEFGLSVLGLEKIHCQHLEGDVRSARMLERLGFEIEGLLKKEAAINSSRVNIVRWGKHARCTP